MTACGAVGVNTRVEDGYLPRPITEDAELIRNFWVYTWIAALLVGALVLALSFWCWAMYRKKKGDETLPEQLQYNIPLEILYTIVPILALAALFFWNNKVAATAMGTETEPDNVVNVVGKQWSWDFNYTSENVHEAGTQAQLTGRPTAEQQLPELWIPVNERTEFQLTARDVNHSFWVPEFLKKLDMIPGRVNTFQVTPTEEGEFIGKCAELCGSYHAQMLFRLKVVSREEFDAHMKDLEKRGQTGTLGNDVNREPIAPADRDELTTTGSNE